MDSIRTNRILSALPDNIMDWEKVNIYAEEMLQNDILTGHNGFPPINGFFDTINSDDLGERFNLGTEDEEIITKKHIGIEIFRVTDGHHRFFAALKAGIYWLDCEKDLSGFVCK